jgi:hypothetical protein
MGVATARCFLFSYTGIKRSAFTKPPRAREQSTRRATLSTLNRLTELCGGDKNRGSLAAHRDKAHPVVANRFEW